MIGAYPGLSNADLARVAVLTPQTTNAIVANEGIFEPVANERIFQ